MARLSSSLFDRYSRYSLFARIARKWLYPVPALEALFGWIYVAVGSDQRQYLGTALILLLLGLAAYFLRPGWSERRFLKVARHRATEAAEMHVVTLGELADSLRS
jgi:hypothetical protein